VKLKRRKPMKWLEIIKVRSAGESSRLREEFLLPVAQGSPDGRVKIQIYHHAALETDFSVHLRWESKRPEPNGSALALRLAQAFKEFGLVDHSVWVEQEG